VKEMEDWFNFLFGLIWLLLTVVVIPSLLLLGYYKHFVIAVYFVWLLLEHSKLVQLTQK